MQPRPEATLLGVSAEAYPSELIIHWIENRAINQQPSGQAAALPPGARRAALPDDAPLGIGQLALRIGIPAEEVGLARRALWDAGIAFDPALLVARHLLADIATAAAADETVFFSNQFPIFRYKAQAHAPLHSTP